MRTDLVGGRHSMEGSALDVVVAVVGVCVAIAVVIAAVVRPSLAQRTAEKERRRRFSIPETGERVPLVDGGGGRTSDGSFQPTTAPEEAAGYHPSAAQSWTVAPPAQAHPVVPLIGRLVATPDGESVMTTPPFKLRSSLFGARGSRYMNRLARRLPAWVVACPKVRLDSLVEPTSPTGWDARDWAQWRRRVRVRSIDILLCDRRGHVPLVAIVFSRAAISGDEREPGIDARHMAGGEDRIIDEVLHTIGLPMVRVSGRFYSDWELIQPYVEQSILPSISEEQIDQMHQRGETGAGKAGEGGVVELDGTGGRVSSDAAVKLLRADGEKGWLLE